jgi:hypothetical protein
MEAMVSGSLVRLSGSSMNHRSTMGRHEATEMATTVQVMLIRILKVAMSVYPLFSFVPRLLAIATMRKKNLLVYTSQLPNQTPFLKSSFDSIERIIGRGDFRVPWMHSQ